MSGYLDIVMGSMFSGKSTELLRFTKQMDIINMSYMVINHIKDNRYGENVVGTHNKETLKCYSLNNISDIFNDEKIFSEYKTTNIILIDEAQFFGDLYENVINIVNRDKKRCILYGLDGDSNQKPFGDILKLVPHADNVRKFKSYCKLCNDGTKAIFTIRDIDLIDSNEQIIIGGENLYKTVCRKHMLEHNNKFE